MNKSTLTKILIIVFFTIGIRTQFSYAQLQLDWVFQIGSDRAHFIGGTNCVAIDTAGNVYIAGSFQNTADFDPGPDTVILTSGGSFDMFIAKYDKHGSYIWAQNMPAPSSQQAEAIAVDASGNVYITGSFSNTVDFDPGTGTSSFTSKGSNDIFITKYDTDGKYLWVKAIGGTGLDRGADIAVDASGSVYVTGRFADTVDFDPGGNVENHVSNGNADIFITKYDTEGNYLWAKSIGGSGLDQSNSLVCDRDGNIFITGAYQQTVDFDPGPLTTNLISNGGGDIFLARYNTNGDFSWAKSMGGASTNDAGNSIALDAVENIYITGRFGATVDFNPDAGIADLTARAGTDIFTAKYDGNGNYIWAFRMGGEALSGALIPSSALGNAGSGITVIGGDIYITGEYRGTGDFDPGPDSTILTSSGDLTDYNIFIGHYDTSGSYVWAAGMGSLGRDRGYAIAANAAGDVHVTGDFSYTVDFDPGSDTLNLTSYNITHHDINYSDLFVMKLNLPPCATFTYLETECDSFTLNGRTYTTTGVYTDTFTTAGRCDSIVVLNLTINNSVINPVVSGTYCDSININGFTYSSSGVYVQRYENITGCDSSVTYDLTIHNSEANTMTESACGSFTFNDTAYTISGTYQFTFKNVAGCDSIVTLDLTINSLPDTAVIRTGSTLTASRADRYQWIRCEDHTIIEGAETQSYTATVNGHYAVILSLDGCKDTSGCIPVDNITNIKGLNGYNNIMIYPNPAGGQVSLKADKPLNNATIRLVNLLGQPLQQRSGLNGTFFMLDMASLAPGIYFIEINEQGKEIRYKLVKE